jgi:hypothetical protein
MRLLSFFFFFVLYTEGVPMSDALTIFAEYAWPVLCHFTNNPIRCERCVNYVSCKGVWCTECQNYSSQRALPKWPFVINDDDKLLILMSGGKDCVYILGELRRQYPHIKIECLLVDTGFLGRWALKNAQLATNNTHTTLIVDNSYKEQYRQTIRDAFLQLKHDPQASCYGVVDYAEGNFIFDICIRYAKEHGQRVVSGLTTSQLAMIDAPVKRVTGALFPLDTWEISEKNIIAGAKKIVGGKGAFGPLDTNCTLIPLMAALDILRLGYCGFESEFSRNIREGLADRTIWRKRFDSLKWLTEKGLLNRKIDTLLGDLGLTRKDVLP